MQKRITKRVVDQLHVGPTDQFVWDAEVKGFGIRCRPSGAKFYVLKMRIGGRQRWVTIGRHGSPWTPETARRRALELLGEKAKGKDPASDRDRRKADVTVAQLGERFLSEYVPRRCKPNTASEYRRAVELFINPELGQMRLSDLTRADVSRFHQHLQDRPYQANRALGVLSKMMSLAEEWGLRPDGSNPCRRVAKFKEVKRERYLTREELKRLGQVLAACEQDEAETPFVIAAIRLLVLTGARLTEITTLKWSYVDLDNGVLRLPDSKTGAKLVHLNRAAVDVLRELPRLEGNPYVIAGEKPGAHLVNLQKPWRRIRAQAELDDVRIHDLRHSFASVAAGAGLSLPIIGRLLGHTQAATTSRYAHLADDPLRPASEAIGGEISALLSGPPSKKERLRLPPKRRVRLP